MGRNIDSHPTGRSSRTYLSGAKQKPVPREAPVSGPFERGETTVKENALFRTAALASMLEIFIGLWASGFAQVQEKPAPSAKPSLYERLGGLYPISAVVDDFIERVYVNPTLNANPNIAKARSDLRKAGLKVHVANLVCMVTGGPCKYTGKGMKEAHANFHITPNEWQALLVDFRASLDKYKVPAAEQKELVDIVESTKPDIVEAAASATKN
jgi:hemoglobin